MPLAENAEESHKPGDGGASPALPEVCTWSNLGCGKLCRSQLLGNSQSIAGDRRTLIVRGDMGTVPIIFKCARLKLQYRDVYLGDKRKQERDVSPGPKSRHLSRRGQM